MPLQDPVQVDREKQVDKLSSRRNAASFLGPARSPPLRWAKSPVVNGSPFGEGKYWRALQNFWWHDSASLIACDRVHDTLQICEHQFNFDGLALLCEIYTHWNIFLSSLSESVNCEGIRSKFTRFPEGQRRSLTKQGRIWFERLSVILIWICVKELFRYFQDMSSHSLCKHWK
jgi:hypothetical protein